MANPRIRVVGLYVFAVCTSLTATTQADPATILEHYRFLPKASVLTETGGFYPHTTDFRVFGTFDFSTGPGPTDSWPGKGAEFSNVKAWASHPILAYVLDLERVLNLSGLDGHQLPVASIFDVYQFAGKTDDGTSVNLYASVLGPWLRMRALTTPPPGSADMYQYELRATARQTPFADFNKDATVDAADLAVWSASLGKLGADDDANQDGVVDGSEMILWQRQVGETAPSALAFDEAIDAAIAAQSARVGSVPEPNSLGLLVVAASAVAAMKSF